MSLIGHDQEILDDPVSPDAASLTGRPFLLSTAGPATPAVTSTADTGNVTLDGQIEVLLAGGAPEVVVQGYGASLPTLAQAIALLPAGPGTLLAPAAVTTADHLTLAGAWIPSNKVALINGPSGANDAALVSLAGATKSGGDARSLDINADWITYGLTVGSIDAPATLGIAAAHCRNDRDSDGNTGIAAAGQTGVLVGARAIVGGPRTAASRDTLAAAQINSVLLYGSEVRNYGTRSLADPTTLPQWVQFAGTRLVMDYRAQVSALAEGEMFAQIDPDGLLIDQMVGARLDILEKLRKKGALYGYKVTAPPNKNKLTDWQAGKVTIQTRMSISPNVEHVLDQIVRRPITAAL